MRCLIWFHLNEFFCLHRFSFYCLSLKWDGRCFTHVCTCVFLCLLAKYLRNHMIDFNETTTGSDLVIIPFLNFPNKFRSWSPSWCHPFFLSEVVTSFSAVTVIFQECCTIIVRDLVGFDRDIRAPYLLHISLCLAHPWWPAASLLGEFLRSPSEITQRWVFASVTMCCLNCDDRALPHTAGCLASVTSNNKSAQFVKSRVGKSPTFKSFNWNNLN